MINSKYFNQLIPVQAQLGAEFIKKIEELINTHMSLIFYNLYHGYRLNNHNKSE